MGTQDWFKMTDGLGISYRRWQPQGEVKRVVLGLHGTGSHSGVFEFVGKRLAEGGWAEVYAIDRRGFGNSVEKGLERGNVSNFKRYLLDVDETGELLRANHPGKELYVFGKSEEAIHTLHHAAAHPGLVDGSILAAPPIKPKVGVPPALLVRVVLNLVFAPNTIIDAVKYQPKEQRESEEIKASLEDPLLTLNYSARFLYGLSSFLRAALKDAKAVQDPILILQGDADNLVSPNGAQTLLEALRAKDKTLKIFPGANHNFYDSLPPSSNSKYDPAKRELVISAVNDWLEAH